MKICFVTTNFPRYLGDSEGTFIWEAVRAVANQGHQVRVIAQHWPGYPTHEWMEDVEVIRSRYWFPENKELLRQPGGGIPVVWKKSFVAKIQMAAFILVQMLTVARFARGFDVIHAQWSLSAGIAALTQSIHHLPIVATLQGSDVFQVSQTKLGRSLTRWVLKQIDQITVLSKALFNVVVDIGVSPNSIKIIPNGVDVNKFSPAKMRENIILYVGSLIKRKGVNYLIDAFSMLADEYPDFSLVIVGDGVERDVLQKVVQDKHLSSQVTFTGALLPDRVTDWMQRARIFVLPSVEEGLGVVLLEALACGTPVIASATGGIVDVVNSDVGILVPPANSNALRDAIESCFLNVNSWKTMSINARNKAIREYSWANIADQFVDIYQKLHNFSGNFDEHYNSSEE